LRVKKELCKEEFIETSAGQKLTTLKHTDKNIDDLIELLDSLGLEIKANQIIPDGNNDRGTYISLGSAIQYNHNHPQKVIENISSSHPTALICIGAGIEYPAYKKLIFSYLLRGINVMIFNYRGMGTNTTGSPTAHKIKLDTETCYQYLKEEKQVKNEHLLIHGYSIGGGPATDLAARHKGMHLLLDRTFAVYRESAVERFPRLKIIINRFLGEIMNFDNAKNLLKVTGHIAINRGSQDKIISDKQTQKLIDNLPNVPQAKLIFSDTGHEGMWLNDAFSSDQFNQFLQKAKLFNPIF
jgi:hypothetical protein